MSSAIRGSRCTVILRTTSGLSCRAIDMPRIDGFEQIPRPDLAGRQQSLRRTLGIVGQTADKVRRRLFRFAVRRTECRATSAAVLICESESFSAKRQQHGDRTRLIHFANRFRSIAAGPQFWPLDRPTTRSARATASARPCRTPSGSEFPPDFRQNIDEFCRQSLEHSAARRLLRNPFTKQPRRFGIGEHAGTAGRTTSSLPGRRQPRNAGASASTRYLRTSGCRQKVGASKRVKTASRSDSAFASIPHQIKQGNMHVARDLVVAGKIFATSPVRRPREVAGRKHANWLSTSTLLSSADIAMSVAAIFLETAPFVTEHADRPKPHIGIGMGQAGKGRRFRRAIPVGETPIVPRGRSLRSVARGV